MKLNQVYQALDGHVVEVTTMRELSLGRPKCDHGRLNRGFISQSFLKLLRDLDYLPLNRGWPLNIGGRLDENSTVRSLKELQKRVATETNYKEHLHPNCYSKNGKNQSMNQFLKLEINFNAFD